MIELDGPIIPVDLPCFCKNTEGERLMKHIREQDYVIALAIDGKTHVTSQEIIEIVPTSASFVGSMMMREER